MAASRALLRDLFDSLLNNLRAAMPGLRVKRWELAFSDQPETKVERLAQKVESFLGEELHTGRDKVSTRTLWRELGEEDQDRKARHRAIRRAIERCPEWHLEGQWLARVRTAEALGFS